MYPIGPSSTLIQSEQSSSAESNIVCENGVCRIRGDSSGTSTAPEEKKEVAAEESQELTAEEKVERAKELLQKKKDEKEREEKEV